MYVLPLTQTLTAMLTRIQEPRALKAAALNAFPYHPRTAAGVMVSYLDSDILSFPFLPLSFLF